MKSRVAILGGVLLAGAAFAGTKEVMLTTPVDLSSYEWTDAATDSPVRFSANSRTNPFTLGQDLTLDGYSFLINSDTLFDFSNGDHTLTGVSELKMNGSTWFKFIGGKWAFKANTWFRFCYTGNTWKDGQQIILDGTEMDLSKSDCYVQGFAGANNVFVMTNGASITTAAHQYFFRGDTSGTRTNNLVHISAGSKFMPVGPGFDSNYAGTYGGNHLVVTGAGSFFGPSATSYAYLNIGSVSCGNDALVTDGAYLYCGNIAVGGGANAKNNLFVIEKGGAARTQQSLYIGKGVGADGNKVIIRDGGSYTNGLTDVVHVGYTGCNNELDILDGGTLAQCYWIRCGTSAGANSNVVRIVGSGTFTQKNDYQYLFGQGQYNRWVFDGATDGIHTLAKSLMLRFVDDVNEKVGIGTTNNTFEVVNGSVLNCYDLVIGTHCASNTVRLADSVIALSHDFKVHGFGNDVILSNATVKLSISGDNLTLGHPYVDESKGEVPSSHGDGNRLVMQGRSKLTTIDANESPSGKLYDNSTLRIEVPPEGYDGPIFDHAGLNLYYPFKIEISGIEALQKNLTKSTKYQLSSVNPDTGKNTAHVSFVGLPAGMTRQDVLDEVNATLPDGCYLYSYNETGLGLRVRALTGTVLIVR